LAGIIVSACTNSQPYNGGNYSGPQPVFPQFDTGSYNPSTGTYFGSTSDGGGMYDFSGSGGDSV
jgi:hypothetical protein